MEFIQSLCCPLAHEGRQLLRSRLHLEAIQSRRMALKMSHLELGEALVVAYRAAYGDRTPGSPGYSATSSHLSGCICLLRGDIPYPLIYVDERMVAWSVFKRFLYFSGVDALCRLCCDVEWEPRSIHASSYNRFIRAFKSF
eukprot:Blabericola_migrator_1__7429@NODE_3789_length_1509_cov_121_306519_g161_i1_p1_GENE_NODE_3789_length_1509_cov_121_306519_g161_i1NODE_3789_length_1509_cov_121_306519_g161_i1_p1_ORF_typecomplete_len141_score10_04_NODE_3789_length_1509_cov_121_306519_g161_i17331155